MKETRLFQVAKKKISLRVTSVKENLIVMIVDDDEMSSSLINKIIEDYKSELNVQGICNEPSSAIKALKDKIPNILFLDVDMPGENGMDMVKLGHPELRKT